jgi:hypothetical protein
MSMIQVVDTSAGHSTTGALKRDVRAIAADRKRLAEYMASAPPWMRDAVCISPR